MCKEKGITLIEIIIVVFMIVIFSMILISNFPGIQGQLALARASYKLAQDLRRAQDLSLSGAEVISSDGQHIKSAGYGIYINLYQDNKKYELYGDTCFSSSNPTDHKYTPPGYTCSDGDQAVDQIDMALESPGIHIKEIDNVADSSSTSINFSAPEPKVDMDGLLPNYQEVDIILSLDSDESATKTVSIYTSGLIQVK
jgi:type II secretory pathway pseudopilin PulG